MYKFDYFPMPSEAALRRSLSPGLRWWRRQARCLGSCLVSVSPSLPLLLRHLPSLLSMLSLLQQSHPSFGSTRHLQNARMAQRLRFFSLFWNRWEGSPGQWMALALLYDIDDDSKIFILSLNTTKFCFCDLPTVTHFFLRYIEMVPPLARMDLIQHVY